jgi:hypothetical protein
LSMKVIQKKLVRTENSSNLVPSETTNFDKGCA